MKMITKPLCLLPETGLITYSETNVLHTFGGGCKKGHADDCIVMYAHL